MTSRPDLTLVTPAHNEAGTIAETVRAWTAELKRLGIAFEWLIFDDGSRDETGAILEALARELLELHVIRQTNKGHGPTVLAGYRQARGRWTFQIDGDDEIGPAPFASFWQARDRFDLIVGRRRGRALSPGRRALTTASRTGVRLLFGGSLHDPNAPFRLMRTDAVAPLVAALADTTFAPNVILSGLAARRGLRVGEIEVVSRPQPARRAAGWNVLGTAWKVFLQALAARRKSPGPQDPNTTS
jgi:glycosyltransferase involved in cell wall biosynthesis